MAEREHLREKFVDALSRLIVLLEQGHDYHAAISYARRSLQADPLGENTYVALMRLHMLNDDLASARRVYQTAVETLRRALGAEPGDTLRAAYQTAMPTRTPTKTATPTRTRTKTPTSAGCNSKPTAPILTKPTNNAQLTSVQVKLDWNDVKCAAKYKVIVKQDSQHGTLVFRKKVTGSQVKTGVLPSGHIYFWRVKACNTFGCKPSVRFQFVKP